MRRLACLLLLAVLFAAPLMGTTAAAGSIEPPTVILLVRHAEKAADDPRDPVLTAAGAARAARLVAVAEHAEVRAVFSTQYQRTRRTAAPLAEHLGLPVQVVPITAANQAAYAQILADRIREEHAGQSVLVVGHSNTVPALLAALGGPADEVIDEHTYDRLYTVVLGEDGSVRVLRGTY